MRALRAADRFQQRHAWLAFPAGVLKKFSDDQASRLAALIAYYGFFSLFPLLLVSVMILGFVLRGNPDAQRRILESALAQFPIIGDQIRRNIHTVAASGLGLAAASLASVWAGMGVVKVAQDAMDRIWGVPSGTRPGLVSSNVRALGLLAAFGAALLASAGLSAVGTATSASQGRFTTSDVLGAAGSLLVNFAMLCVAFRMLTVRALAWRDVMVGAAVGAVAWALLQSLGSYWISHNLKRATPVYGFFGVVLGLLSWLYLAAQVGILSAEVNVVLVERRWPRSLLGPPPGPPG